MSAQTTIFLSHSVVPQTAQSAQDKSDPHSAHLIPHSPPQFSIVSGCGSSFFCIPFRQSDFHRPRNISNALGCKTKTHSSGPPYSATTFYGSIFFQFLIMLFTQEYLYKHLNYPNSIIVMSFSCLIAQWQAYVISTALADAVLILSCISFGHFSQDIKCLLFASISFIASL